jgi:polysaccharide export outer membrane protein
MTGGTTMWNRMMIMQCCFSLLLFYAIPAGAADAYVIGDEDVLQISVWGNQELNVQVPVRPDGMISFPLVGDVRAAGMSPNELRTELEKQLAKFVKAPTVSVIVTAVNSFRVYILGDGVAGGSAIGPSAVAGASGGGNASGVITLRKKTSLMQLLAQLGSLRGADLNSAYLLRAGKRLDNDFYKLAVKGNLSQDIPLQPNDVLFIPDNFDKRIMVVGAVKTPNIISYRDGLTALDAILYAGGFTEFANQNDVLVVRKNGGAVKNIEARLKDVMKDGDISKDVPLEPGDLIIVKTGLF